MSRTPEEIAQEVWGTSVWVPDAEDIEHAERVIRARDAEVRAEELRLAAHELEGATYVPEHALGRVAIQYLRDRADRIETGASNE